MKIEYKYVTGETVEVEVGEEWAKILIELDREEYNDYHRETRRHFSLDAVNDKDDWLLDEDDIPEDVIINELYQFQDKRIIQAVEMLTQKQRELIEKVYCDRWTMAEYAKHYGFARSTISQRHKAALKKIKKVLETT